MNLKKIAFVLAVASVTVLLANAATTTIWDDETNGYYLSRQPLDKLLILMRGNVHEDPPLFDLLLHYWIPVAGFHPWALRLLPIAFWAATMPAVYLTGKKIGGTRGGAWSLIVLALMPYHWLNPASLRWYSTFACLASWNLYALLVWWASVSGPVSVREPDRRQIYHSTVAWGLCYIITGALLWYTNYSAPLWFAAHLVVVAVWSKWRKPMLWRLVAAWTAIGLCFLPWLPTLLAQLSQSMGRKALAARALGAYMLWAGEFSTPFQYWLSIPVAILAVLAMLLMIGQWRHSRVPLTMLLLIGSTLFAAGVMGMKRMLIVSPLLALGLGLALAASGEEFSFWKRKLRTAVVTLASFVAIVSFGQMVTRQGWASYRWLDPFPQVVRQLRAESPDALLLTSSNTALFYLHDDLGMLRYYLPADQTENRLPQAWKFPLPEDLIPAIDRQLDDADHVVYCHHGASWPLSSRWDALVEDMRRHGLVATRTDAYLTVNPVFLADHSKYKGLAHHGPYDDKRVVVTYFVREHSRTAEKGNPPQTPTETR